jgi:hypothetical protein
MSQEDIPSSSLTPLPTAKYRAGVKSPLSDLKDPGSIRVIAASLPTVIVEGKVRNVVIR